MEKNEIILWAQGKSVDEGSLMSYNKTRIENSSERYHQYYAQLVRRDSFRVLMQKEDWLIVYKDSIGHEVNYVIHGHYTQTDVVGRPIAFMARISAESVNAALDILIEESKHYGYSLAEEDVQSVRNIKGKCKIIGPIVGIALVVIIVAVVKSIWK